MGRPCGRGLYSATVVSGDTGEHRNSKGRYASLSLRGLGDATLPKGSGLVKEPIGRIMHVPRCLPVHDPVSWGVVRGCPSGSRPSSPPGPRHERSVGLKCCGPYGVVFAVVPVPS